jgi:hypothetical protein
LINIVWNNSFFCFSFLVFNRFWFWDSFKQHEKIMFLNKPIHSL